MWLFGETSLRLVALFGAALFGAHAALVAIVVAAYVVVLAVAPVLHLVGAVVEPLTRRQLYRVCVRRLCVQIHLGRKEYLALCCSAASNLTFRTLCALISCVISLVLAGAGDVDSNSLCGVEQPGLRRPPPYCSAEPLFTKNKCLFTISIIHLHEKFGRRPKRICYFTHPGFVPASDFSFF